MPNQRMFSRIDNQDIIEDVHKVTTGFFTGGTGKLTSGNLVTKSLSTTLNTSSVSSHTNATWESIGLTDPP